MSRAVDDAARADIAALLAAAEATDGHPAVDERRWRLVASGSGGAVALLVPRLDQLAAYGQLVPGDPAALDLVIHPEQRHAARELAASVIEAALAETPSGAIELWLRGPGDGEHEAALAAGFEPVREVVQLRRSLPVDEPADLVTRAFQPGVDNEPWVALNRRAFAAHPDQGRWTLEDLRARMDEPWFDAEGFLVHERDGALDGFCWTKAHPGPPALGEIYVIAADPSAHGTGLGRALVLAGLDHLARQGLDTAMLYTDADNEAATRLYARLGFERHHIDRAYQLTPTPSALPTT